MGESSGAYRVLVERPEGKRSLGSVSRRLEYNIKIDVQEVGWRARTGLICTTVEAGGRLFYM